MNTKTFILVLSLLLIGCSSPANTAKDSNSIIGKWKLSSVENDHEEMTLDALTFLTINYTEMDRYVFTFEKDGKFEQNYFEPAAVDQGYDLTWEISDSILTTYFITEDEKTIFINGQFKFLSADQFLLKTKNQTVTFERIK